MDNITLVEISQVPQAEVLFNVSFFNIAANQFSISATPVVPVQNGCGFYWEVEEIDANNNIVPGTAVYNPSQWWINPPYTFNGYVGTGTLSGNNPGVFSFTKRYRIIYGRWCPCLGYNSYAIIVDPLNAAGMPSGIKVLKDDKYVQTPAQTAAIVQGIFTGKGTAQPEKITVVNSSEQATAGIQKLKVYPNPVDESMTLEFPENPEEGTLMIYNMQGEVMLKQPVSSKQVRQQVNTGSLAAGTYLIHYKSNQGEILAKEKFVKIKK